LPKEALPDRNNAPPAPRGSVTYSYDSASQLTGLTYKNGSTTLGNLTYSYDLAGRRINTGGSYARTGTPQAAPSATYNVNNQLTQWKGASLTYDANGNLTSDGTNTYTWNARNQLVAISGATSASFQYDPFGRRVSKTISGMTQYLYDGANPVQEISGTSTSANLLTGGLDEYFQRTDSAGARSFLTDALGGTLALADSSGALQTQYTFEPFGNTSVTGATTTNSFAYTGRELDATGLYFNRARYYNPSLQRFISEDPIGFNGGINFYAYTANSPTNLTDPFGLQGGGTTTVSTPPIGVNPPEPTPGQVQNVIQQLEGAVDAGLVGIGNVLGAAGMIFLSPTSTNTINGQSEDDILNVARSPQPNPPMAGRNCKSGGGDDPCKGLRDILAEHQRRLQDYARDPYSNDAKGLLGNEYDESVIAGRVKGLVHDILEYKKQLEECERMHGQR
jgi:RHS repeat-associated protein